MQTIHETQLRTGDVLLVHNYFNPKDAVTYISAAIRLFSRCYFNHSAIILKEDGVTYVVEAVYPKVTKTPFSEWIKKGKREILVQRRSKVNVTFKVLAGRIKRQIGKKYDVAALLIHLPLMLITKWLGEENYTGKSELDAIKRVYCFEIIANVYREFYPTWFKVLPAEQVNNPNFTKYKLGI
jgi:hypothetical protein